jgi:hypothetical protein
LVRAAESAVLTGDDESAEAALVEVLRVLDDLGTRRWAADALELATVVLARREARHEAVEALAAATELREASGEPCGGVRLAAAEVRRVAAWLQVGAVTAVGAVTTVGNGADTVAVAPETAMARARSRLQRSADGVATRA